MPASRVSPLHVCCNSGYGQTGPYVTRAGYDVMVEAEMGLMHITGKLHTISHLAVY